MFRKLLIANRGEIAVRIIRTCREMGIKTLALYQASDQGSLHVRLSDECVQLEAQDGFLDQEEILRIANQKHADAIHPGYGFLAERDDFIRRCDQAGVRFIGPPADVVERVRQKIECIERVKQAGYQTVPHTDCAIDPNDFFAIQKAADNLGYPVIIKSCRGGRGRGSRLVLKPERLLSAVHRAQVKSQRVYNDRSVFLEKAVLYAHQIGVQVIGDNNGSRVHLGEREGSLIYGNQKIIEESPAPSLSTKLRSEIWTAASGIAKLFNLQNVATVEFLVDDQGQYYFTEIKPRIQIEHPLTEMLTRLDLVREQIRLANGEMLGRTQSDISLNGWAMQCRVSAENPWMEYMPTPGYLQDFRYPGGPDVRMDTYLFSGAAVPVEYDPLIAKLLVWGIDRETCLSRFERAINEILFSGIPTNISLIRRMIQQKDFSTGIYSTGTSLSDIGPEIPDEVLVHDLAAIAAIAFIRRKQLQENVLPERLLSGWHRESRRLSS